MLFGKMKDSISTVGQEVSQKAKTMAESVRISNAIKENEKMIEKLTFQVGIKCVENHVNEQDSEYGELFAEILRLKAENRRYRTELEQLDFGAVCPKCGLRCDASARFCVSCGSELSRMPAGGQLCGNCGHINCGDAFFCEKCGFRLEKEEVASADAVQEQDRVSLCGSCGSVLDEGCLFCTNCGARADA